MSAGDPAARLEARYRAAVDRHEAARERLRVAMARYAARRSESQLRAVEAASEEADRLRLARSRAHVAARQPGLI